MAKFVLIDSNNRVLYVADSRPTIAGGDEYIEVSNDSVAHQWYYDGTNVHEFKPYDIEEVRVMRNERLEQSDWMVIEDSPYKATGQEANLANIKTYRQELRDFPNESTSYNENNINWPTLTLS